MRTSVLVLLVAISPALALAAEHPVHDGKWEITNTTTIPGMPAMPPQVHTQCITKKDPVPNHESKRLKNCKMLEQKMEGATVKWKVQCEGAHGPTEGAGEMTYARDTLDGKIAFKMNNPRTGEAMEVTSVLTGKRIGECDDAK